MHDKDPAPDNREWHPLPLGNAFVGHLSIALLGTAILAIFLWAIDNVLPLNMPHIDILSAVIVAYAAYATLGTLVDRYFSLKYRHDDPGNKVKTVLLYLVCAVSGALAGLVGSGGSWEWVGLGALIGVISFGVELTFLTEPWRDGMTRNEFRDKWDRTKDMTHEVFSEEIDDAKDRMRDGRKHGR